MRTGQKEDSFGNISYPIADKKEYSFGNRSYPRTFSGSVGMMTTAKTELPYPCVSQAKTRDESSRRGK